MNLHLLSLLISKHHTSENVIDPQSWNDYFPAKANDNPFPRTFDPPKRPLNLPREGPWQYSETDWAALDVTDEQFGGDWLVTKWVGDQLAREHDQPFFLACGIYRPHEPRFVPKQYFEPFPLEAIQLPPGVKEGDLDDVPPMGQKIARNRYFPHIQQHRQWKQGIQAYLASIHFADAMLGRVLAALEKSPHRDNTIVVLWSDHGHRSRPARVDKPRHQTRTRREARRDAHSRAKETRSRPQTGTRPAQTITHRNRVILLGPHKTPTAPAKHVT